ncbi:hypothetical protein TGAM01_v209573 [Trichoderma gamsii]|uniref:Uncharacterized protein n=1 Tax=Trichoderma gamsii TaxID=398673 RepID=A0A2P4ZB68_9HYPO|nr:hypothetical protein TGAM01_v209573 [Trichoderma gamsii]PON21542.1 hypothetical protein TGAM01_v209573 [Trichoderma gamsii]
MAAESSTTLCPSLPEYACPPLGDEWSPLWLQRRHEDEDWNKVLAERMMRQRWRRIAAAVHDAWLVFKIGRPLTPPLRAPRFRWLISSDLVPRGYQDGQAPWRMLIRSYLKDLPGQLADGSTQQSVFSWRNYPRHVGRLHHRTKLDDAPPEITCGRRAVFSQQGNDFNQSLTGEWLVIVYIWATDSAWLEKTDVADLVSRDSVTGIRAWEWIDAVDAPTKLLHLFYTCQTRKSPEQDAIYAGLPYLEYNAVPMKRGDPVPARLAGLRRLMKGRARHLYCAAYEYDTCTSLDGQASTAETELPASEQPPTSFETSTPSPAPHHPVEHSGVVQSPEVGVGVLDEAAQGAIQLSIRRDPRSMLEYMTPGPAAEHVQGDAVPRVELKEALRRPLAVHGDRHLQGPAVAPREVKDDGMGARQGRLLLAARVASLCTVGTVQNATHAQGTEKCVEDPTRPPRQHPGRALRQHHGGHPGQGESAQTHLQVYWTNYPQLFDTTCDSDRFWVGVWPAYYKGELPTQDLRAQLNQLSADLNDHLNMAFFYLGGDNDVPTDNHVTLLTQDGSIPLHKALDSAPSGWSTTTISSADCAAQPDGMWIGAEFILCKLAVSAVGNEALVTNWQEMLARQR